MQTGDSRADRAKRGHQVPDYDPKWDALTLAYQVRWPLHLLLSPEVLPLYGRLFQYLFRLKRLQLELDLAWAALSRQEGGLLWRVRGHMAHIVNNLQLYMQARSWTRSACCCGCQLAVTRPGHVQKRRCHTLCLQADVIEVQFSKLVAALAELRDLKAASQAHQEFLTACAVQSCLDVPLFSVTLGKILANCKAFCAYVQVCNPWLNKADVKLAHPERSVQRTPQIEQWELHTSFLHSSGRNMKTRTSL